MFESLRRYRLLYAAVAASLVLGVTLPVARYACAMTGISLLVPSRSMASTCPEHHAAHMQQIRGCDGPGVHLCPEDGSCPHAEKCRTGIHMADDGACCSSESFRAEQAAKVDIRQYKPYVALPLTTLVIDVKRRQPSYPSISEVVVSRSEGDGVPIRVLFNSFLL